MRFPLISPACLPAKQKTTYSIRKGIATNVGAWHPRPHEPAIGTAMNAHATCPDGVPATDDLARLDSAENRTRLFHSSIAPGVAQYVFKQTRNI